MIVILLEHQTCTPYVFVAVDIVIIITFFCGYRIIAIIFMIIIIFIVLAHLVLHAGSLVVSVSWVDGSWENEQVWQNIYPTKNLILGDQNFI